MNDEYEGQGGSYVIDENGARKLVERTREPGDAPPDPHDPAAPAPQEQPAEAGFFTPGADAAPTATTAASTTE